MNDRIDAAIDRSEVPDPPAPEGGPVQVRMIMHPQGVQLENLTDVTLTGPKDPAQPMFLIQHEGAWLAVMAEPGSHWELRRKGLWVPGAPS